MEYSPTWVPFRMSVTQDATCAIERWMYISMSGYIFDFSVHDLYLFTTNSASKPIFSYDPANIAFIPTYYPI